MIKPLTSQQRTRYLAAKKNYTYVVRNLDMYDMRVMGARYWEIADFHGVHRTFAVSAVTAVDKFLASPPKTPQYIRCVVCCQPFEGRQLKTCSPRCFRALAKQRKCKCCGEFFTPNTYDHRYCSRVCGYIGRELPLSQPVKVTRTCETCGKPLGSPHKLYCSTKCYPNRYVPTISTERVCFKCGKVFRPQRQAQYCSRKCYQSVTRRAREARLRDQFVEHVSPNEIYKRDNNNCQICGEPVDLDKKVPHPRAPVLDHIHPISKGGLHERKNIQLAHHQCNMHKSNKLTYTHTMRIL